MSQQTPSLARPVHPPVAEAIADRLRVLGQSVRIRVIDRLDHCGEQTVSGLADALGERPHNVSQHLATLRSTGAVTRRHQGREVFYQLSDAAALEVYDRVAEALLAESARQRLLMRRE